MSDSPEHSRSGSYEVIKGIIYLEVDPENPANQLIVDLQLAERNSRGYVEFSTDFELHKPINPDRGNFRLLYFVNNRGNKLGEYHFNHGAGKNWLYANGMSYLWCGWNCDVIKSERLLNINVPVVKENGVTIIGKVYAEMISYANEVVYSRPIVWGGSTAYPFVEEEKSKAALTKRQYRWQEPVEIARKDWFFGRKENGQIVDDPNYVYIKEGFTPGWLYDLVFVAKDPKLTGLGLAAIRDVVSFFKYEKTDENGLNNPLGDKIRYAYGWGHSQSARLLNFFVFQDFNGDEGGRKVFDGILANCPGGGKGQFNSRFAQTTRHGSHHEDNLFPVDFFPFTTVEQFDPITGEQGDGLARARESGYLPKMFYINTSTDYWTRAASLLHTDVEGKKDAEIDPNVRIYAVAGLAHTESRVGIVGRALLRAMDLCVSYGISPPDSQIPKISDGSLVSLDTFAGKFPAIPGSTIHESFYEPYRLNPGSRWNSQGIADFIPPKTGPKYACLVPQVDADGNEIAGVRMPEIVAPLATYIGWSLRSPSFSNTIRRNAGRVWPLPVTPEERKSRNDSRKSILERYPEKSDYLSAVKKALLDLKQQRLLLDGDADLLRREAEAQDYW